jgi:hypothetical protein
MWPSLLKLVIVMALVGTKVSSQALGSSPTGRPIISRSQPPAGPEAAVAGAVKPIVDGMRDAQTRLGKRDPGEETRKVQERVVNDLQKLIDLANQGSGSRNPSSQPRSPENQSRSGQKPRGQEDQSNFASRSTTPQAGGKPGTRQLRPPVLGSTAPANQSSQRQVWGHLPPALRDRVKADFGEVVLPAYDDLVRRYYDALLEGSTPAARKAPAGN